MQQGPKIVVVSWALKKSFPKSANGNRGAGRQSGRTNSTEKFFVFKDVLRKYAPAKE